MITYGKEDIVNWITTLADSWRVATDLGSLRFSLKNFHKPLYSFKGSFIICKAKVEKLLTFENGIKGSIAEDSYFAIKAIEQGYSFDWVEGEMHEKSPFTISDFVKQRKRWVQGIYLLVNDRDLKWSLSKICITYAFFNWSILPIQLIISMIFIFFPLSVSPIDIFLSTLNGTAIIYLYFIGTFKSLNFWQYRIFLKLVYLFATFFIIPFSMVLETIALIWGICSDKKDFYIVIKQQDIFEI